MTEHIRKCSVTDHIEITPAGLDEYRQLEGFHYRGSIAGPYAAIFAMRDAHPVRARLNAGPVGVIVYTMPAPNIELRNIATGGFFTGFTDRRSQLELVNRHIRCISRVIIEPRYRSLGLATELVRQTMPRFGVSIIESMAVMGQINPFFEKAGMKAWQGKEHARTVRLIEALGMVGISEDMFIDPQAVQARLDSLLGAEQEFISRFIDGFIAAYGKRRFMQPGIERTRFMLSRLTARPVYYIWLNPESSLSLY